MTDTDAAAMERLQELLDRIYSWASLSFAFIIVTALAASLFALARCRNVSLQGRRALAAPEGSPGREPLESLTTTWFRFGTLAIVSALTAGVAVFVWWKIILLP